MLFTGSLLGLLYVVFGVALFYFLNVGLAPLLVIVVGLAVFQYYTSDKLALAASGAKIVSAEEAPELHAMVERLCAMAGLPKPRVAIVDTDVPNAFRYRPESQACGDRRDDRPLAAARAEGGRERPRP
jgi:heat shock protein HtpX